MNAPTPTGEGLGLIYGHSLPTEAFDGTRRDVAVGRAHQPVPVIETDGCVALPRHGIDEFTPAHRIDHAAHIRALCEIGCDRVVALCSVGSLRLDWQVGTLVCPDDFLAHGVAPSFHTDAAGHTVPGFDAAWRSKLIALWQSTADTPLIDGGTYAQTSGPRFETPAEVRHLGAFADLVGMTMASECVLAREAGLAYAAICTVDNLANGLDTQPLTVEEFRVNKARNEARTLAEVAAVTPVLAETAR